MARITKAGVLGHFPARHGKVLSPHMIWKILLMALSSHEAKISNVSLPDGVPEILVDGFNKVSVVNDIARLNFFSLRGSANENSTNPTIVCRIAISLSALVELRKQVNDMVDNLIKQGYIQTEEKAKPVRKNKAV